MTVETFINNVAKVILNPLIVLMFAVALLYFLWGVVKYIQGANNPESRKKGTQHILWGLIGLFIMVSVYGIIQILLKTFFTS